MNYAIVRQVIEHPHLKDKTDFAVMMVLAYHSDAQGSCSLKTPTLAEEARITPRCAEQAIERLRLAGYFTLERGGGKGKTNCYQLHPEHGKMVAKTARNQGENHDANTEPRSVYNEPKKQLNTEAGSGYEQPHTEAHTPKRVRCIAPNTEAGAVPYSNNEVRTSSSSSTTRELLSEILITTRSQERYEMGAVSATFRADLDRLVAYLEKRQRAPADVQRFRQYLPAYLNKPPEAVTTPTIRQMFDTFDRVLEFADQQTRQQQQPQEQSTNGQRTNHNGHHAARAGGRGASSGHAGSGASGLAALGAKIKQREAALAARRTGATGDGVPQGAARAGEHVPEPARGDH